MKGKAHQWARQVVDLLQEQCPEIITYIKDNPDYVFPFYQRVTHAYGMAGLSQQRVLEIENKAVDILNQHYTKLIRDKL